MRELALEHVKILQEADDTAGSYTKDTALDNAQVGS